MKKDKQQPRPTKRNKVRVVSARFTDIEYQAVENAEKMQAFHSVGSSAP